LFFDSKKILNLNLKKRRFFMESLLKELNGETTIISYDKPTGAWIFIAIFSTRLGSAGGGNRMKLYPDVESALQAGGAGSSGPASALGVFSGI
jgi:hypothetical protein